MDLHWLDLKVGLPNLLVTLFGTLFGVLFAFQLNRLRERRRSREEYYQRLSGCLVDLANLHTTSRKIAEQVKVGVTNILEIEAPTLQAFLESPLLYEHGGPGVTIILRSLSGFIAATRNMMNHYRLAAALERPLNEKGVKDTKERMSQIMRGINYVQGVIEQELEILRQRKWGVPLKRLEIKEAAEGFAKALRGSE